MVSALLANLFFPFFYLIINTNIVMRYNHGKSVRLSTLCRNHPISERLSFWHVALLA